MAYYEKKSFRKACINNKSYLLPIYKASEGSDVIDITKLYAESNHFTYDPGFTSTASCQSNITYIDGEKGILRYRGYDIEDLAKKVILLK
jgi:citrate synthase